MSTTPINFATELLAASQRLPAWQQDALRRLNSGPLTPQDYDELVEHAKHSAGFSTAGQPPIPLSSADLSQTHAPLGSIKLAALHSVKGVNALQENQRLNFGLSGITVIYGENGAGKSGYARILRRACRARKAPALLPNVRVNGVHPTPEASFDLIVSGATTTTKWTDGSADISNLARFAVFDRECERGFVDEQSEVAFVPPALGTFDELARLVEEVRRRILAEAAAKRPSDNLEDLTTEFAAHPALLNLLDEIKPDRRDADYSTLETRLDAVSWSADDAAKLEEADRLHAEAREPKERAKTLRELATSLTKTQSKAVEALKATNDDAVALIQQACSRRDSTREAARLAEAGFDFSSESISGVGGEAWRELFLAAMRFATGNGPRFDGFPTNATDAAACPLCLQDLTQPARERLARFGAFIAQEARAVAEAAKKDVSQQLELAQTNKAPTIDPLLAQLVREILASEQHRLDRVLSALAALEGRRTAIIAAVESGDWAAIGPVPDDLEHDLETIRTALDQRASEIEALINPEAASAALKARNELLERSLLARHKTRLASVVSQHRAAAGLNRVAAATKTTRISAEGKQLAEKLLSNDLRAAFSQELSSLGASSIALAGLTGKAEKGKSVYGLALTDTRPGAWKASGVLSEGEQRVIALAYFLAEARMAPDKVGMIFDDPVSSLDHRWAERIAKRFAALGTDHQLIVFTHSISFAIELERCATKSQTPFTQICIARNAAGSGLCDPDLEPWEKLSVGTRVSRLRSEVKALKDEHDTSPDGRTYRRGAVEVCSLLRAAWERAVEEVVLAGVIERFGYAVSTGRLKEVVCTDQTFKTVNDAMTRLSAITEAHDTGASALSAPPSPSDLLQYIAELEQFVKEHKLEQKKAREARGALEAPPPAAAPPAA